MEIGGFLQVGGYGAGGDGREIKLLQTLHRDITEAVEGEAGAEYVLAARTDKGIRRTCGAEIGGVEIAVAIKLLSVVYCDFLPALALYAKLNETREILPEVEDLLSLGTDNHLSRRQTLQNADGSSDLRHQLCGIGQLIELYGLRLGRSGRIVDDLPMIKL